MAHPKSPARADPHRPRSGGPGPAEPPRFWLYGQHAVAAALANPRRPCLRLLATANALGRLGEAVRRPGLAVETAGPRELARVLPEGAVHQGLALEVGPLPPLGLAEAMATLPARALVLALDQVSDPRNLGAILRSAVALGAGAVVLPERRSADLGGACAKAASGALDLLPIVEVTNLARALVELKALGFWAVGLDAAAGTGLEAAPRYDRTVLVLGAEGEGLRRLVAETCDLLVRIPLAGPTSGGPPIAARVDSLNVAVAAGIALYVLARRDDDT